MTDDMRAAFEAWISGAPYELDIARMPQESTWPGQYVDIEVQRAWEAWRESARRICDSSKKASAAEISNSPEK